MTMLRIMRFASSPWNVAACIAVSACLSCIALLLGGGLLLALWLLVPMSFVLGPFAVYADEKWGRLPRVERWLAEHTGKALALEGALREVSLDDRERPEIEHKLLVASIREMQTLEIAIKKVLARYEEGRRQPGSTLLRIARTIFVSRTGDLVFLPIITDMTVELEKAPTDRARFFIEARGILEFWKAFLERLVPLISVAERIIRLLVQLFHS